MGHPPFDPSKQIPPAQALWQVFEVVMNVWILWTLVTAGLSPPLVVWTVFEVLMNGWILVTMVKVGIKRRCKICFQKRKHKLQCPNNPNTSLDYRM